MKELGLVPLCPFSLTTALPPHTPGWPEPTPCCVAFHLVGHLALMLSKNLVNDQHCSLCSLGLSSFSVKNQLNSFSKWGILHSEDTQWASFTSNSVSSNRGHGACQQSPCETGMHRLLNMNHVQGRREKPGPLIVCGAP